MVWHSNQHTTELNVRWAWLRAVEWLVWPLFLSQPIVPILLLVVQWKWVIFGTFTIAILWRYAVAPYMVSMIADYGPLFVMARFVAAPLAAIVLVYRGEFFEAFLAITWPWLGPLLVGWVVGLPGALLSHSSIAKRAQVGVVQKRFLTLIGIDPALVFANPEIPDTE